MWKKCIDEENFIEITNVITLGKLLKSISWKSFFIFAYDLHQFEVELDNPKYWSILPSVVQQ